MKKKSTSKQNKPTEDVKAFTQKHNSFLRCCMNCLKRRDCEKIPAKGSMKRWQEWCGIFLPDYRKIDRTRTNHATGAMINPNSASGKKQVIVETGGLLGRVEATLNSVSSKKD
jgi:hypothetical protein